MALSVGGSRQQQQQINITPLVDIVLVLLIIFMVMTPLSQWGHLASIPPKNPTPLPAAPSDAIILRLDAAGQMFFNREHVPAALFPYKLSEVLRDQKDKMVFVDADDEVPYEAFVSFVSLCRANGAVNVGLIVENLR